MLSADENVTVAYAGTADAVVLGVMLAVLALVCRYGAELKEDGKSENEESSEKT